MRLLEKLEGKTKYLWNLRNPFFLIIFITFLYHSYQLLVLFLEYQTTVYISEDDPTDVDFPAVTVCTNGKLRHEVPRIWEIPLFTKMKELAMELSCYKINTDDRHSGNCYEEKGYICFYVFNKCFYLTKRA
ncbi:uncharacterized protein LOC111089621, partial [Limulus polyphemus]|uniref:Uncharacterized protein LOC111089621 n=1 Tax=Limulus polyphemus TaxID=6850 RepID=A0ABM1TQM1_LIMPO